LSISQNTRKEKVSSLVIYVYDIEFDEDSTKRTIGEDDRMTNGEPVTSVGSAIHATRTDRKMTQRSLASAAKVGVGNLNYIENGKTSPTVGTLERISGALGIKLSELFGKRIRLSSEDMAFMDTLRLYVKDIETTDRQRVSKIVKRMTAK